MRKESEMISWRPQEKISRFLRKASVMQSDSLKNYNSEGMENDKHFFFILGTPRSGTKWFSKFFSTDEVFCFHELTLLCHGTLQSHRRALMSFKPIPGNSLESQLHRLFYLYPSFGRHMYHKLYESRHYIACGNSDSAQMNLTLALNHIFPHVKFLIVLRNGFDVALSLEKKMMEPDTEKIIENHKKRIMEEHGYHCENLFEIACWRWRNGTERLLKNTAHLAQDRTMLVNFETVFSNPETLESIWNFLLAGKVPFNAPRAEKLFHEPANKGIHEKAGGKTIKERWLCLDVEKKGSFTKIAGPFIQGPPSYTGWTDLDF